MASTNGGEKKEHTIVVWICANCGNYYGSSSAGNLSEQINKDKQGNFLFSRSRCPTCRTDRTPCAFKVELIPEKPQEAT